MDTIALHLSGLAGRTRQNRMYTLRTWRAHCASNCVPPEGAARADIDTWIAHRRDSGIGPRTICTDLAHLAAYYRWLVETGRRGDDPTALIRRPRRGHSTRPWLGRDDARALLDESLEWEGGELAAQVHLWLLSGLRPGEPRMLRVEDLSAHDGAPTLRVRASKTPGTETLVIPEATARVLHARRAGRERGPLLLDPRTGRAWTGARERRRFHQLREAAGVPYVTPAGLRVSMITLAISSGIPERDVSVAARHSSTAITARYDRLRTHMESPVGPRLAAWIAHGGDTLAP